MRDDERSIESLRDELDHRRRWQRRFSRCIKRRLLVQGNKIQHLRRDVAEARATRDELKRQNEHLVDLMVLDRAELEALREENALYAHLLQQMEPDRIGSSGR